MSEKQTCCPNCSSIYKVTVTQLTVAQGMVCCPKCTAEFNALLHLVQPKSSNTDLPQPVETALHHANPFSVTRHSNEQHLLDIFDRKTDNSNINLRTYLNNLNSFNNEPIANFPALNLSADQSISSYTKRKSTGYYVLWSLINLSLIFVLMFQVLWFNPNLLQRSPLLNWVFITTCNVFKCQTIDERYTYIRVSQIQVRALSTNSTEFSGVLTNHYEKGLALPLMKISLMKDGKVISSSIRPPSEYLIESLNGITRIPTQSPYKFQFKLNVPRNAFDTYRLAVIRP